MKFIDMLKQYQELQKECEKYQDERLVMSCNSLAYSLFTEKIQKLEEKIKKFEQEKWILRSDHDSELQNERAWNNSSSK